MRDEQIIYEESDTWGAVPWGMLVLACAVVVITGQPDAGAEISTFGRLAGFGIAGLMFGGFALAVGKLTLVVRRERVEARFGVLGWIHKKVPLSEVVRTEAVRYRPMRDFGGWGIRVRPGRRAWSVRGNQAVRLTLADGMEIYLGTRHPQRLQERIELVRGSAGSGDVHAGEPDPGSGANRGEIPPNSDET